MLSVLIDLLTEGFTNREIPYNLNGNKFAARLISFIRTSKQLPDLTWLLAILLQDKADFPEPQTRTIADKDRRIRTLFLRNVRQYCLPDGDEKYYSFDFTSEGQPVSSVIQGANGSGKTSIYASIEHLYLGWSNIADSHSVNYDGSIDFFRSIDFFKSVGISNDTNFEAVFKEGERIETGRIPADKIPAMFCSECDYFELTRNWKNKKQFIASQIGYEELLTLLSMLRTLVNLLELENEYTSQKREIRKLDSLRKSATDSGEISTLKSKIGSLRSEQKILNSRFLQEGGSLISNHISRFAAKVQNYPSKTNKLEELNNLIDFIAKQWNTIIKSLEAISVPIIKTIMEGNLDARTESVEISADGEDLDVHLKVCSHIGGAAAVIKTPAEYFNTFRLKLFCISFKLALLCCAEIKHGINMPFVVDDIFDSSDFCNRKRIRGFIKRMFDSHYEAICKNVKPDNGISAYPLQMLFFTQDNIIAENVYQGIKDFIEDSGQGGVKFGRLFRPCDTETDSEDVNGSDCREYDLDGEKIKTLNIEDSIKSYVRQ